MTIITDHFSKRPVTLNEGNTNATIRWHFVLVYLTFHSLTISFEGQVIAGIKSSKQGPEPGFENQFGINWIVSQNLVTLTIFNSTTDVNGVFTCEVSTERGFGTFQFSSSVEVNIVVPPKVTLPKRVLVGREQTATLICEVEGNPKPNISWSGCDQPNHLCDKQYLSVLKVQNPCTNYTCTGRNYLGSDSATTVLIIGGNRAYIRLSTCGECEDKDSIWETLENKLSEVFANTQSYIGAKEIHVSSRSGSLIFDVVLNFKSVVTDGDIISSIQTIIKDGKLGNLRVNVSFIIGNTPVEQPTTGVLKISPPESHGSTWLIIGVVLGSVALVALIVFIYCVCKKMLWTGTKGFVTSQNLSFRSFTYLTCTCYELNARLFCIRAQLVCYNLTKSL
ncbi:uncharacterized protein LOC141892260 isoform X6 [Acropora palmata]|uniref:uncharacterized protein LOC141892260 isoform X6 n=1 Tax=Acropora palmata TaxID=6131 RepID=UPI003DA19ACC